MHPAKHCVRLAANLLGPLAGIHTSGPDHVQGQKTFPGSGMFSREGQVADRFGLLSLLGKVWSHHVLAFLR